MDPRRLIDAAVDIVRRTCRVSQQVAAGALRDAGQATAHSLGDVAAGLVLADHLPPSLVARLRDDALDFSQPGVKPRAVDDVTT